MTNVNLEKALAVNAIKYWPEDLPLEKTIFFTWAKTKFCYCVDRGGRDRDGDRRGQLACAPGSISGRVTVEN